MHFLNTGRALMRHADMHIGFPQRQLDLSAAPAGQRHHGHFALMRRFNGSQHIGRVAAGGQRQQHVAGLAQFAARRTTKQIDGVTYADNWFAEDFTLAELKTLRAIQTRGRSTAFDGQFEVPTFDQVLNQMNEERVATRARRYLRDLRRDAIIDFR